MAGAPGAPSVRIEPDPSAERFYAEAGRFSDLTLYQTPAFAEVTAAGRRASTSRALICRGDAVIGACSVRIKQLPLLGWGVAYALGGPLWRRPGATPRDLQDVLTALRQYYVENQGHCLRLRPRIWQEDEDYEQCAEVLAAAGYQPTPHRAPDQTLLLDLTPTLDEIRARFQRRWRQYLNRAERSELTVQTDLRDESFAEFLPIYEELKRVKWFRGIDGAEMRRVNQQLPPDLRMEVTLCHLDGRLLAGQIASCLGQTCLGIIGAANVEGRDCFAANLVWWERIKRAREAGCTQYDFGGYDPHENRSVAEAKLRLGARVVTFVGEFGCAPSAWRAWLLERAETLYRRLSGRQLRDAAKEAADDHAAAVDDANQSPAGDA